VGLVSVFYDYMIMKLCMFFSFQSINLFLPLLPGIQKSWFKLIRFFQIWWVELHYVHHKYKCTCVCF